MIILKSKKIVISFTDFRLAGKVGDWRNKMWNAKSLAYNDYETKFYDSSL